LKQLPPGARRRLVLGVAFHSNGMEISTSGYDVIRTANLRRSGVATIQPSKRNGTASPRTAAIRKVSPDAPAPRACSLRVGVPVKRLPADVPE
jgi:hypothetical protein